MRFRRKPVEVDAVQWKGNNQDEVSEFIGGTVTVNPEFETITFSTPRGHMVVRVGGWVFKDSDGIFYTAKEDVFLMMYEPVNDPNKLGALDDHV
jgi:hypothetical protein